MDLRRFHYFVTVAEELHVGRAAQTLGIAQPALSQHIRALEEQLGVRLFLRANRRITLTAAGDAFLAEARATLFHAAQASHVARRAARGETGSIVIGYVSSALAEQPFVRAMAAFRLSHPEVAIEMQLRLISTQLDALREQRLDLSIIRGPLPATPEGWETLPLVSHPLLAVLPEAHPLAGRARIALAELANDTFLLPEDPPGTGLGASIQALFAETGFHPQRSMVVNEMSSNVGFVSAGLGVGLLPASARVMRLPGVAFCELSDAAPSSELLVLHRRFERSPAVLALLAKLREQV